MKVRNAIKEFAIITVGTAIVAAAVFFFMLPSHVSVGSGAALAMVLSNFIPLSVSTITLMMNVGLLIIGFILTGPEFGAKTIYCSILMPVIMGVFEWILERLCPIPVLPWPCLPLFATIVRQLSLACWERTSAVCW